MRWKQTITMVEAHAEGEVGRIVTSFVNDIPGKTMLEKINYHQLGLYSSFFRA